MATLTLPSEFKTLYRDKKYKWFLINGNIRSDTVFAIHTTVLEDVAEPTDLLIGVRRDDLTYTYEPVKAMRYIAPKGDQDQYFDVEIGVNDYSRTMQLVCIDTTTNHLSDVVDNDKLKYMVHLFKGLPGENGKPGENAYEVWSKKYPGHSYDTFVEAVNNIFNNGTMLQTLQSEIDKLKLEITEANKRISNFRDEIPIGALLYSHVCPDVNCWLRFGHNDVYNDMDYPELAKIVKSWGANFIVDNARFKLGDFSTTNRYLVGAGGNRPAGTHISSQLPNITGQIHKGVDNTSSYGCFYDIPYGVTMDWTNRFAVNSFGFDASRSSSLYKNGVTQVFGDSLCMNIWIKARLHH